MSRLTRWLRVHLLDTPLESVARSAYIRFSRSKGVRYERELRQVMARVLRPDSNGIDVGAHRGGFLSELVHFAPLGEHIAFEPVPRHADYVRSHFPGVTVHAMALGNSDGVARFQHVITRPTYSGLKRVRLVAEEDEVEEIEVPIRRLDDMVPADRRVDLLKVDVEGAEFQVFRGALETIRRWRPFIAFEHSLFSTWHYDRPPGDVYDLLSDEAGMQIALMVSWLAGGGPLGRAEFIEAVESGREHFFLALPRPISNI